VLQRCSNGSPTTRSQVDRVARRRTGFPRCVARHLSEGLVRLGRLHFQYEYAPDAVDTLTFRVLGPLWVGDGNGDVTLSGSRRRVVLVRLLVSANQVVPVGRLIEDVWDGAPPAGAASTLQSHVSVLRGALGKDRLEHRDGGYVVAVAEGELDARLFEVETAEAQTVRAAHPREAAGLFAQALGRWHGEALADAAGMGWAVGETTRLEELRAGATEAWLSVRLELGDHTSVVPDAESAVSDHPLQEGLWAALMLALYRCGRQSDALRAYRRLSSVLGEALGIEPSTQLRDLEDAILLQKPDLDWHDPHRRSDWAASRHEAPPVANNLPVQLSSFLGRAEELATGARLLQTTRLLTVTGPGGTGKTRLAYRLAGDRLAHFPDGVWVTELAPLSDPELVPGAVLSAIGLRDQPGKSTLATVVSHLADRDVLLVLDNCEHLVLPAAALTADLLRGCPRLRVLATSREPLRVAGETVWSLGPLGLPEAGEADPEVVADADAVALFCERATNAKVGFRLTEDNAAQVSSICARTEGLPLAVELAAARVRTLSLNEIARLLGHDLDLLSKGPRGEVDRHSSLRATVAWSHELLDRREQMLFRRLSVFAGGFTMQAAEAVCAAEDLDTGSIVEALDGLVDKSLVNLSSESSEQGRYQMLETIRAYATESLHAAGEELVTAERHTTWCAQFVRDCKQGDSEAARRLNDEHPNLLAALDRLPAGDSKADHGELVLGLFWWWDTCGQWQMAGHQLRRYVERSGGDRAVEARCLGNLGSLSWKLGAYSEARSYTDEALAIASEVDDRLSQCQCMAMLGDIAWQTGDLREAQARLDEALALSRAFGYRQTEQGVLNDLGCVAIDQGDFSRARSLYEEALTIVRELGDHAQEARVLANLAAVAGSLGNFLEARARYEDALRLARKSRSRRDEEACIGYLGEVAIGLGEYAEARARCEEALVISRELGDRHFEAVWVSLLGEVAYGLGQFDEARTRCEEALAISRELGERHMELRWHRDLGNIATELADYSEARARYLEALSVLRDTNTEDTPTIEACADLLARLDHTEEAAQLLAAADNFSLRDHRSRSVGDQARYEAALATCGARLDQDALAAASARGRSLDWKAALSLAAAATAAT
jgi:predicted ATPase/DNA-binding SARP family transcriptional activator/Tfp pilus assembly protein PilF